MADHTGLFYYNLSYNVGYSVTLHSGDTAILTMINNVGVFDSVRNASDIQDQTMWIFTFVRNPYVRILAAWNSLNIDFIADPATKATAFHDKMLSLSGKVGIRRDRNYLKDEGDFRTQVDLLRDGTGQSARVDGRKQNFVGKIEDFATDIITVETQMRVSLNSEIWNVYVPDSRSIDTDLVFADTTYDVPLLYADAYALQATKDLVYLTYQEDFDAFSYKQ